MIRPGIRRLFRLALHRRDLAERDVEEEIRTHLDLRTEELTRRGFSPEAARAEALRRFGALDDARRRLHDAATRREHTMMTRDWWDAVRQDLAYARRGLRREPLFTAFVVATLALGIGTNAAMFGVVDRLLLRGPEQIVDPSAVMRLYVRVKPTGMDEFTHYAFGWVTYDLMRRDTALFDGVAAYNVGSISTPLGRGADGRLVAVGGATSDFFPMLGVHAVVGRFFDAAEDSPSAPAHVAVLGYGLWQGAFGGDRSIVGRTIVLADESYTVVGVAPKGFTGPQFARVDAWVPMSLRSANTSSRWTTTWNSQWLRVVVRVKGHRPVERLNEAATTTFRHAYTGSDSAMVAAKLLLLPIAYNAQGRETAEAGIARWLVGVAAIVLLIACANVVNLLLARTLRRQREVAVRLALGAGRRRLVRLLLTESLLLASMGGAAGLAVAWLTGGLMRRVLLPSIEWPSGPVDGRVLALSAAIALTVGVVVGLIPALRASRPDLTASLKGGVREGGVAHGARLRAALTVAQAALSLVLLVGAGLFVRSLDRVRSLDLGIQPERVLVVNPQWPPYNSNDTASRRLAIIRRKTFNLRALERARSLPGVERASITVGLPFESSFSQFLRVPGWDSIPVLKGGGPIFSAAAEDYFETVGTRVLRGRAFTVGDREGSEPVAIVNETMAKAMWPGRNPIGDCLFSAPTREELKTCARIVGVVADSRRFGLREESGMHYYIPLGQEVGVCCGAVLIRPRGDLEALAPVVHRAMLDLDPTISYLSVRSLQKAVDPQIRPWRLGASMFGLMGALALLVAAVGLYSVLSYLVAQRTHEIGVRLALGARGGNIMALVLRSSVGMAALGVAIGTAIALWAGRFVESLLFDTSPRDPVVIGGVALTLLAVAFVAGLLPALRARRVDPMEALRGD